MENMEVVNFFIIGIFILVIAYIKSDTTKRINAIDAFTKKSLAPDNVTVTRFRADLDSIMKYVSTDPSNGNLMFKNGVSPAFPSTKMVISPDGKVGIGTQNPETSLHIVGKDKGELSFSDNEGESRLTLRGSSTPNTLNDNPQVRKGTIELIGHVDGGYIGVIGAKRPKIKVQNNIGNIVPGEYGLYPDGYFNSCIFFNSVGTRTGGSDISFHTTPSTASGDGDRKQRMLIGDNGVINIGTRLYFSPENTVSDSAMSRATVHGFIVATGDVMQINTRSNSLQFDVNNFPSASLGPGGEFTLRNGSLQGTLRMDNSGNLLYNNKIIGTA